VYLAIFTFIILARAGQNHKLVDIFVLN